MVDKRRTARVEATRNKSADSLNLYFIKPIEIKNLPPCSS
jgi:hypothetical protein